MTSTKNSLEKNKIKFLLLEGLHDSALNTLQHAGYNNIDYLKTALPQHELIERVRDAHFIGIRSRTQLNREVLAEAKKLIAIGCFCIGTNQVDLNAAQEQGIAVFNAPYSNTRSVAELVIAEAILLLRNIPAKNAACHLGQWQKSASGSYEIRGKTLGIVGYGAIGSQVSVLAESLGMRVVFFDTMNKLPMGNASAMDSLKSLLEQSHVVSMHVPETLATKNMIGERELAIMQRGSVLINASRGTVIDIDALTHAVASEHLAGAAIDVFPTEPKSNQETFVSPLREHQQVILTPHIGGSTIEAQENIGIEVAEKLVRYSDNGSTISSVNFPEAALPTHSSVHRLLHIHHNIPGVLSAINQIFSQHNINICSQYLQTKENIGYVVLDVDSPYDEQALEKLKKIEGTVKCRVLF